MDKKQTSTDAPILVVCPFISENERTNCGIHHYNFPLCSEGLLCRKIRIRWCRSSTRGPCYKVTCCGWKIKLFHLEYIPDSCIIVSIVLIASINSLTNWKSTLFPVILIQHSSVFFLAIAFKCPGSAIRVQPSFWTAICGILDVAEMIQRSLQPVNWDLLQIGNGVLPVKYSLALGEEFFYIYFKQSWKNPTPFKHNLNIIRTDGIVYEHYSASEAQAYCTGQGIGLLEKGFVYSTVQSFRRSDILVWLSLCISWWDIC